MRLPAVLRRPPVEHLVSINDVRPDGAGKHFEPYFAAIRSCGWVHTGDTESLVRAAAEQHNANVAAMTDRPVG